MSIALREITHDNWIECIFLTTNQDGNPTVSEEFVASNALSIAQSKIENGWVTKAIYNDDKMIGFTMYGFCEDQNFYEICRFMIDHRHQNKGYGKLALQQVIDELKIIENCSEIYLSFDPENTKGKALYESLGFKDTNKLLEGELLYVLPIT